jgi:hypothetical protein
MNTIKTTTFHNEALDLKIRNVRHIVKLLVKEVCPIYVSMIVMSCSISSVSINSSSFFFLQTIKFPTKIHILCN